MKTERLLHAKGREGEKALHRAAELLRSGKLVAFPTDTVYGLGAMMLDPAAVLRIFEAKGRPRNQPLLILVASVEQARKVAKKWPPKAELLAERFWPGPLTIVLPKASFVPEELTSGAPMVGVRQPGHPVALRLIEKVGQPLAAPSANRHGSVSPTTADHVAKSLDGRIDAILDGGPTQVGIESTILLLDGAQARILRQGAVSQEAIEQVIGKVSRPEEIRVDDVEHMLWELSEERSVSIRLVYPLEVYEETLDATPRVGVISLRPRPPLSEASWHQLAPEPDIYARQLYAAVHELEERGVEVLLIELPPPEEKWDALRERLRRLAR